MIRLFEPKDKKYIIDSHYEIYNKEHKFDATFKEFIEASINEYMDRSDFGKEQIWILEMDEQPKGSIGITKVNEKTAQLRLFLVDPNVRGEGFGTQLLEKAIDYCKEANYENVILWTNNSLTAARHLYAKVGFSLKEVRKVHLSKQEILEEQWESLLK